MADTADLGGGANPPCALGNPKEFDSRRSRKQLSLTSAIHSPQWQTNIHRLQLCDLKEHILLSRPPSKTEGTPLVLLALLLHPKASRSFFASGGE